MQIGQKLSIFDDSSFIYICPHAIWGNPKGLKYFQSCYETYLRNQVSHIFLYKIACDIFLNDYGKTLLNNPYRLHNTRLYCSQYKYRVNKKKFISSQ